MSDNLRRMKKMVYSPSIFWLVMSCLGFAIFVILSHFALTELITQPPSSKLLDQIAYIFFAFAFIAFIIEIIFAILIFDFWCRPVILTENELARGFIFKKRIRKEDITGIGLATVYGTKTPESIYNNCKYAVYVCTGQYDEALIKRIGIWETLMCSELIKVLRKCRSLLKKNGTGIASFDKQAYPDTIFFLGEDLNSYAVIKAWMSEA